MLFFILTVGSPLFCSHTSMSVAVATSSLLTDGVAMREESNSMAELVLSISMVQDAEIVVPVELAMFEEFFIVTEATPCLMALKAFSILGIIPLFITP